LPTSTSTGVDSKSEDKKSDDAKSSLTRVQTEVRKIKAVFSGISGEDWMIPFEVAFQANMAGYEIVLPNLNGLPRTHVRVCPFFHFIISFTNYLADSVLLHHVLAGSYAMAIQSAESWLVVPLFLT
jgi:hypothetical protein